MTNNEINYDADDLIPAYMRAGMQRYIEKRIAPGSFMQAVLENDLLTAVSTADDINIRKLPDYVKWLYNHAPAGCWGDPERVANWLRGENDG